jgi:NAD(P)-dependent dehydrogenase (short-subunit alcohol dehydrogenase family)
MDLGIRGRTAIVCAASRGLGRAIAIALAREGVNLVINARSEAALKTLADNIEREMGVLFWALRGGGGNFGAVTEMRIRLHELPNVVSGMLIYPFSEARTVLRRFAETVSILPDELTVQFGAVAGPDGVPVIMLVPTWSGRQGQGDEHIAPLLELGTLLVNTVDAVRYGTSLSAFDPHIVNGQRVFMETCSLPALDSASGDLLVEAMASAVSSGCAIFEPRIQRCGFARAGGRDGVRPSSRSCAD